MTPAKEILANWGSFPVEQQIQFIQEFQLDAAKWGAEQAANIVLPDNKREYLLSESAAKRRVLAFANNLTIDQLPK